MEKLLSEQSVTEFVEWALNQGKVTSRSVKTDLCRLRGLRAYPALASCDFSWVLKLMAQLPQDCESKGRERKEANWVPFDKVAKIPEQICRDAHRDPTLSEVSRALMMRNALVMAFLTILPWRQGNIRNCKLGPFAKGGNLAKEEIPVLSRMSKPMWVEAALQKNPHEKFWQFCFRPHETKTGWAVRAFLPQQLVQPLEEYLTSHRKVLLGENEDPGTLFFTRLGHPLSETGMLKLVGNLTMKYAGRRVNPHLMRDIYAVKWLEDHPEDYLTLSKILWHRNIQTTLQVYGAGFDESHGARRVDEWLEQRQKSGVTSTILTVSSR